MNLSQRRKRGDYDHKLDYIASLVKEINKKQGEEKENEVFL